MSARFLFVLLLILLAFECSAQVSNIGCLDHKGKVVDWFAIITTPQAVHDKDDKTGYLYFDSTMKTSSFKLLPGYGNQESGPIGRTIAQIATYNLQNVAWNDQPDPEWGLGAANGARAHSKGYIGVTSDKSKGFLMDHSTPEYPSVDSDNYIQAFIKDKQRVKAQHHFCLTIKNAQIAQTLFDRTCFINPNVYINDAFDTCKKEQSEDRFRYNEVKTSGGDVKSIYKNGHPMMVNDKGKKVPYQTDIFLDGIAPHIESSIIAQTYGAPGAYQPTCDTQYTVGNSYEISVNGHTWRQGSDHSKWAYALDNDFTCFGDLNRNSYAQTTRGGAFYCVNNPFLNHAIKEINPDHQGC